MMTVEDVALLASARLLFGRPTSFLRGVSTDTRKEDMRGKLYVALKGATHDGHDFLGAAADKEIGCALIEGGAAPMARRLHESGKLAAAVAVPDTLKALGELAKRRRSKLKIKIVAITGSNGKTSAKDFSAAILSTTYRTLAAPRSFNNAVGVPMTILEMTPEVQVGVLEIGMNHPGEIDALCRMADPDVVAITSIACAHVGFFRSLRQVALAKSEILTAGRPGITAFLPAETPFLPTLRRRAAGKTIRTFGVSPSAGWRVSRVQETAKSISFVVGSGDLAKPAVFRCPNFGAHQLTNVLLAIAIGFQFAVPVKKIRGAVSRLMLPPGRGEILRAGPHILIDDTYNANPGSMAASLKRILNLRRYRRGHEVILVLGDMMELGDQSGREHTRIGILARAIRPVRMIYVGKEARHVFRGYVSAGGNKERLVHADTAADALSILQKNMGTGGKYLILIKGSRQMRLEQVVDGICQNMSRKSNH